MKLFLTDEVNGYKACFPPSGALTTIIQHDVVTQRPMTRSERKVYARNKFSTQVAYAFFHLTNAYDHFKPVRIKEYDVVYEFEVQDDRVVNVNRYTPARDCRYAIHRQYTCSYSPDEFADMLSKHDPTMGMRLIKRLYQDIQNDKSRRYL